MSWLIFCTSVPFVLWDFYEHLYWSNSLKSRSYCSAWCWLAGLKNECYIVGKHTGVNISKVYNISIFQLCNEFRFWNFDTNFEVTHMFFLFEQRKNEFSPIEIKMYVWPKDLSRFILDESCYQNWNLVLMLELVFYISKYWTWLQDKNVELWDHLTSTALLYKVLHNKIFLEMIKVSLSLGFSVMKVNLIC